jgi:hypothetical protein
VNAGIDGIVDVRTIALKVALRFSQCYNASTNNEMVKHSGRIFTTRIDD